MIEYSDGYKQKAKEKRDFLRKSMNDQTKRFVDSINLPSTKYK